MKKLLTVLLFFSASYYMTQAQQCEKALYNFNEGATWELAAFDKKDKQTSHTAYVFSDVSASDASLNGKVKSTCHNEKGKQLFVSAVDVQCKSGDIVIDVVSIIPDKLMESYRNGDFVINQQDKLLFPASIAVGATLPNGKLNAELDSDGSKIAKVSYETTERSVLAKESVTVPAGTFECYKISTKIHSVTTVTGIGLNYDYVLIEWFAYGVGVVRSETYKKDKLETYSVLTKSGK